jgi:hypothetical protein
MDEQKENKSRGKKERTILVLAWAVHYLPTFIFP